MPVLKARTSDRRLSVQLVFLRRGRYRGVGRFTQPTDLRIIRVPCSGRVDPLFIAKALLNGADGVLVSGCHPSDCHYAQGNFYARRRLEVLKQFLPVSGSTRSVSNTPGFRPPRDSGGSRQSPIYRADTRAWPGGGFDAEKAAATTPRRNTAGAGASAAGVTVPSKEQVEALKKAANRRALNGRCGCRLETGLRSPARRAVLSSRSRSR